MSATAAVAERVEVRCDLCGGAPGRPLYRLDSSWIVQCARCDFRFVNPRAEPAVIQRRLQEWSWQDTVDQERLRIAFDGPTLALYRRYLGWLGRLGGRGGRLLDIGCSVGAFLSVAREAGWECRGLEIGEASAGYARDTLGLEVDSGSLYDWESPAERFDAVALLEVIEHLESPRAALERIHAAMAPDGLLLITTPNFDALFQRLHGSRWWVINCEDEHIVFFNLKTLTRLLEETGFQVAFHHIRGFDITGMLRLLRRRRVAAADSQAGTYYEARAGKERVKRVLRRLGLERLARLGLRALDWASSRSGSPLFAMGEQLIVIARRR